MKDNFICKCDEGRREEITLFANMMKSEEKSNIAIRAGWEVSSVDFMEAEWKSRG